MQTKITKIDKDQPEYLEIHCYKISDEVREIIAFVKSRQGQLTGTADERQYEIAVSDVFYIESVDNRNFIYTKDKVYETRHKLYELEEMLAESDEGEFYQTGSQQPLRRCSVFGRTDRYFTKICPCVEANAERRKIK